MKQIHTITLYGLEVTGENEYLYKDLSFDHLFGTERRGAWVAYDTTLLDVIDSDGMNIPLWCFSEEFKKHAVEKLRQEKI